MEVSTISSKKFEPTFDVTAFGETMLRHSIPAGNRLTSAKSMDTNAGGAESNTLAALSGIGRRCGWFSAVSDDSLGGFVIRELAANGIDTKSVIRSKHRLGKVYVEFAEAPRPINVIYDREHAAITQLSIEDVDWDYLLDTRVLHLTGITPALSPACNEIILEAIRRVKSQQVKVSFDINYRSKLWSPEQANACLKEIIKDVDLLICGGGDAETVFGIKGSVKDVLLGLAELSNAEHIVLTRSKEGSAILMGGDVVKVKARAAHIIDRLGAGDAFAAGVIEGLLNEDIVAGMKLGSVLSSLALSQHGDMLSTTREEAELLSHSNDTSVQR